MIVEKIDVLVIGGGVTGCYVASKLKKRFEMKRIILIEASKTLGGRLYSEEFDKKKMTMDDEIGGLHFIPTAHWETEELLKKAKARTTTIVHDERKNMFSYQGKSYRESDVKFPCSGRWKGKHPKEMETFALIMWKKADKNRKDPFLSHLLRKMNLRAFFKRFAGANDQEFDFWTIFRGAEKYDNDNISAAHWVQMMKIGKTLKQHSFVKHGYGAIANKLVEDAEVDVRLQCKATFCENTVTGKYFVQTNNPKFTFIADQVFVCLTVPQIHGLGLTKHISAARKLALNAVKTTSIFRIKLAFKKYWWHPHGFSGKTTITDKDIRSIHYENDDIVIHAEGKYADFWERKFRDKNQVSIYNEVWDQMKRIHKEMGIDTIPEPKWKSCSWAYWPHNHAWGTDAEPNARACMNLLAEGNKDGSKIFICGEAYSDMQGWVEGCFHSANAALNDFDQRNSVDLERKSETPEERLPVIENEMSEESCCTCCCGEVQSEELVVSDSDSYSVQIYDDVEEREVREEGETFRRSSCFCSGGCCSDGDEEEYSQSEDSMLDEPILI